VQRPKPQQWSLGLDDDHANDLDIHDCAFDRYTLVVQALRLRMVNQEAQQTSQI
jgi:hypothetical protein